MTRQGNAATDRRSGARPRIAVGTVWVLVMVALAAVTAWPIYASSSFLVLVGVATVAAVILAVVSRRWQWPAWLVASALAALLLVIGVTLAVPGRGGDVIGAAADLGAGILVGWKDLVTVSLPVGTYRNLLVPALVVFLVIACAALLLAWRRDRVAYVAAPLTLAMTSFGLVFGRTTVSAPITIGPVLVYAPRECVTSMTALVATLLWLGWRSRDERRGALRRAGRISERRAGRRRPAAGRVWGAAMLAVAVTASIAVVPLAAAGAHREVLRSGVGPRLDLSRELSPLSMYREAFSDDRVGTELFRVRGDGADRIRIATLDHYDGEVFRASTSADGGESFLRTPSAVGTASAPRDEAATSAHRVTTDIAIDALGGVWMPTVGRLDTVAFSGARAGELRDGFFYNAAAQAGVQMHGGGFRPGDAYRVVSEALPATALTALVPPATAPRPQAPESLTTWVRMHRSGAAGPALAELVALLRARGYLSHGLSDTSPLSGAKVAWVSARPGYRFQPSASGHSLGRIDGLFTRLLQREADPGAAASGDLVAAVGDDEQFAVAVALIAGQLGFPARVVVGVRLASDDPTLPVCHEGECVSQDLAAWTEVQDAAGAWSPIDVTPQAVVPPNAQTTTQRDPEVPTVVRPAGAEEITPPDPVGGDAPQQPDRAATAAASSWFWPAARIGAISLAALIVGAAPFLVIVIAKILRRRGRRTRGTPAMRVSGGWDEYVDAAVDSGRTAPAELTRRELAAAFGTRSGAILADAADRAVFSHEETTPGDAEQVWDIIESERRALTAERRGWGRIRAHLALRSFARHLAPRTGTRRTEKRGRRRPASPSHTS